MSALKPEDIVFSLKKPYLLVYSNAPMYLGRPFGYEQVDSRERPVFSFYWHSKYSYPISSSKLRPIMLM